MKYSSKLTLFSIDRVHVQMLTVSSRENSTFVTKKSYFSMRQQTTTFLFQLRQLLFTGRIKHNVVEELLRPFALYLEQLNALPIVDVLHTIHSNLGNEVWHDLFDSKRKIFTNSSSWFQSTSPAYHLLHGHIEWRWIYLTICLRIEQDKLHQNLMISENTLRNTEFEEKLQLFLYDLILISAAKFNKVKRNLTSFTLSQLIQLLALSCIRQSCHWRAHSLVRAWRKYGCWSSYWWNDFMKMAGS